MFVTLSGSIGLWPEAGEVICVSVMGQTQECDHLPVIICSSRLDTEAKQQGDDGPWSIP